MEKRSLSVLLVFVLSVLILYFISACFGDIYEYRGVTFYPNGSQNVSVSKLYVSYDAPEAFSIYIFYRNQTFYIPYQKNITLNLPPKKFKISINISAYRVSGNIWNIRYKITNKYPYGLYFNVSFPNGFNLKNTTVFVPANSYKIISLSKIQNSDILYFGESNISFNIPSIVRIRYSLPIPFSIIKSEKVLDNGSIEWTATYVIKNNKNIPINVNATYWAIIDDNKVNLGNYSYVVYPYTNITQSFSIITDYVPIFYLRFYAWVEKDEIIYIKPAIKIGNSYIVGIGKVEGIKFYIPYNIATTSSEETNVKTSKKVVSRISPPSPYKSEPSSHTYRSESKTSHNIFGSNSNYNSKKKKNSNYSPTIKKLEEKAEAVAATVATVTSSSLTLMLIPPIFRRRSYVVDRGKFSLEEVESLYGTVYVPEGCKLGKILPGGITIVRLTESEYEIAKDLHKIYNIPMSSAKAIILGIRYGSKVYLSDRKASEVALDLGLEAYYFGTGVN